MCIRDRYSLKQIPLIKRILPATLYRVRGLKIFANLLSLLWEIISVFLGKFLYFITMVVGFGLLYETVPADQVYLHILLFLTIIGAWMNTNIFNPTKDKYYAMILMRMDARKYTPVSYTHLFRLQEDPGMHIADRSGKRFAVLSQDEAYWFFPSSADP